MRVVGEKIRPVDRRGDCRPAEWTSAASDAATTTKEHVMIKMSILTAISGALVAGSLALAGPAAAAHREDAGDGSGTPAGMQSGHLTPDGQIGIGIFTNPASSDVSSHAAVGSDNGGSLGTPFRGGLFAPAPADQLGVGIFTNPASATSDNGSCRCAGSEQPYGPVGVAPAV
jgi:hypothetical protein